MEVHNIKLGFFRFGFTEDINKSIKNCGKCHSENISEKIPTIPKIIIANRPHIRFHINLWYLQ